MIQNSIPTGHTLQGMCIIFSSPIAHQVRLVLHLLLPYKQLAVVAYYWLYKNKMFRVPTSPQYCALRYYICTAHPIGHRSVQLQLSSARIRSSSSFGPDRDLNSNSKWLIISGYNSHQCEAMYIKSDVKDTQFALLAQLWRAC